MPNYKDVLEQQLTKYDGTKSERNIFKKRIVYSHWYLQETWKDWQEMVKRRTAKLIKLPGNVPNS